MTMLSWEAAQRVKGGVLKYLYNKVAALETASGGDETDIAAIKAAIGDETTEGTILYRVKTLEDKE